MRQRLFNKKCKNKFVCSLFILFESDFSAQAIF
ncbi:hypothetical protein BB2000_2619 [Proteus mirabilis BB2000]|nr:hypothetical protein BB2000_2619 [Proteus mirabilis BB2000]